eukprot:scaffold121143_cov65-Attheya_sp.AAC.1
MQSAGTLLGGVTLVIVPLLALGADQVTKILRANQAYGVVKGYHLDEIKTPERRDMIIQELLHLNPDSKTSIFIFASPQAIVSNTAPWRGAIHY